MLAHAVPAITALAATPAPDLSPRGLSALMLSMTVISVGGWVWETAYCSITERHLVRRGFLFGPSCPIYGTGAVIVYVLLGHLEDPFAVFVAGAALATAIEYATGRVLEERFGRRWWDYSGWPLNYRGLICPMASAVFGVFSVLVVFVIGPQLMACFYSWGELACVSAAAACALTLAADTALSVMVQDAAKNGGGITLRR
ncbi:MAG: putative ABC transporter permease [Coriobacteriaceae bacterium]|nr:putative ABC transporter permease [Coriobacteriaceae bacterium]